MSHYREIYRDTADSISELQSIQGTINNLQYYYELSLNHPLKTLFPLYLPEWFIITSPKLPFHSSSGPSESNIANQLFAKGFCNGRWPHYLLGACLRLEDLRNPTVTEASYFLKVDHPERLDQKELRFIRGGQWICMLMKVQGKGLSAIIREYKKQLSQTSFQVQDPVLIMDVVNIFLTTNPAEYCTMIYAPLKESAQ